MNDSPPNKKRQKRSLSKLAIRGVFFNWTGRSASFLITFITTPLLIHGLGNEAYGLWAIVMAFVGYYALADIGLQGGVVKYISQFEATEDRESLAKLFRAAFATYTTIAAIVFLLSIPIALAFPYLFALDEVSASVLSWTIFLSGISVALRMQGQVFVGTIRAFKRFDIANVISVCSQVAMATISLSLVYSGFGLLGVAIGSLSVAILTRTAQAIVAHRLLGGFPLGGGRIDRDSLKMLLKFGGWNLGRQLAVQIHLKSGPLIGGVLLGPAMVPFFAVAASLSEKSQALIKGVVGIVMPVASHLDAQERKSDLLKLMLIVPRALMPLSLFIFVFAFFFGDEFISAWIDPSYVELTYPIACILALANVATTASRGINAIFIGAGEVHRVTKISIVSAIAFVVLSFILVPNVGLIGLAVAVLLPTLVVNLFVLPAMACRTYEYSFLAYHGRVFVRPLIAITPAALLAFALDSLRPPVGLAEVIAYAGAVAIVAATCAYFLCLDPPLREKIRHSLLGKSKRKKPRSGDQDSRTTAPLVRGTPDLANESR